MARQLTAASVAERLGVTAPTVSNWENERAQPRAEARQELSEFLGVPERFFIRSPSATAPSHFRFRSLSAATKRARLAAEVRSRWLHEIVDFLDFHVDLPRTSLPRLDLPDDPSLLRDEDIEFAARETRRAWGLHEGPIPDLTALLEAHGIVVACLSLNTAKLDGLSGSSSHGRAYVLINSEHTTCVRQRFDAAHELGHLVLHSKAPSNPCSAMHKEMEAQAHHFAGAFVFPREAVVDEVAFSDLDSLVQIKSRWRLSVGALIFRLFQVGLIDTYRKARLQRQLGMRGWKRREPLDDTILPERPSMLRQAYSLLHESGHFTRADISHAVPLGNHDHEVLAGLPARWMSRADDSGKLVRLKSQDAGDVAGDHSSTVIPFRRPS